LLRPRIIPCLLLRQGGLVKTVRFADARYVGDPLNAARIFNEKEVDELIVLDIDASVNDAVPDLDLIRRLAAECRMPLCFGGGIRTLEMARAVVRLGVEKVALGAAALADPALVTRLAAELGRQSVVAVLDVRARPDGSHEVFTHRGARGTGRPPLEWAREFESLGAGEILVNCIDRDGMMQGYDLALAAALRPALRVPLTFLGGAGSLADISALIGQCGSVGAAAGSLFVYKGPYKAVLINYPDPVRKEGVVRAGLAARDA
jgi:imidazole glycerol-phosphate synthase subunit HisF